MWSPAVAILRKDPDLTATGLSGEERTGREEGGEGSRGGERGGGDERVGVKWKMVVSFGPENHRLQ